MIKFHAKYPGGPVDEIDPTLVPLNPNNAQQGAIAADLSRNMPGSFNVEKWQGTWRVRWNHVDGSTCAGTDYRFPDALASATVCHDIHVIDPMKTRTRQ